jgi:hypothetical protein
MEKDLLAYSSFDTTTLIGRGEADYDSNMAKDDSSIEHYPIILGDSLWDPNGEDRQINMVEHQDWES